MNDSIKDQLNDLFIYLNKNNIKYELLILDDEIIINITKDIYIIFRNDICSIFNDGDSYDVDKLDEILKL